MWVICDFNDDKFKPELRYYIDNEHFCIYSSVIIDDSDRESELFALFVSEDDYDNFSIGKYYGDEKIKVIDKQYSMSYMNSNGYKFRNFSHFKIVMSDGTSITAYPKKNEFENIYSDRAIINAREILSSLKNMHAVYDVGTIIDNIRHCLTFYNITNLPIMNNFIWYTINNTTETFGLSSVSHLISSDNFYKSLGVWYFGVCDDERVYAISVRCDDCYNNPLGNADDCTIVYTDENTNCNYFVVGLILLDDGQYFCRLD